MKPREIQLRVLEEHETLRGLLDELDGLTKRLSEGEEVGAEVREFGTGLFEVFAAHLSLEDALLAPALATLAADGPLLADRLKREHGEQRELLRYLLGRLEEAGRPTLLISNELYRFSDYVRRDMQHEEETILREGVLRSDA